MKSPKLQNSWTMLVVILAFSFYGAQSLALTKDEPPTCSTGRPKNCAEIQSAGSGFNKTQICSIYPFGPEGESVEALCDFDTDGGAWTVIQKRTSGPREEFDRNRTEYEEGFGSAKGNLWIGLKMIHALTKDLDQELRIQLGEWDGAKGYAVYSNFSIADSSDEYRLSIRGYSGTVGDGMTFHPLDGMGFTTKDKDNDKWTGGNCAERHQGAWWHNQCGYSNLNGLYFTRAETPQPAYIGVFWTQWSGSYRSLTQTEMKIRPRV